MPSTRSPDLLSLDSPICFRLILRLHVPETNGLKQPTKDLRIASCPSQEPSRLDGPDSYLAPAEVQAILQKHMRTRALLLMAWCDRAQGLTQPL